MIWLALAVLVLAWGVWRGLVALSLAMMVAGALHDRASSYRGDGSDYRGGRLPL